MGARRWGARATGLEERAVSCGHLPGVSGLQLQKEPPAWQGASTSCEGQARPWWQLGQALGCLCRALASVPDLSSAAGTFLPSCHSCQGPARPEAPCLGSRTVLLVTSAGGDPSCASAHPETHAVGLGDETWGFETVDHIPY